MTVSAPHHPLPQPVFDRPVKLLIVVAPVYPDITDALLAGARAAAGDAEVEVLEVPGVTEIPPAIAMAGRLADFHGCVALGCLLPDDMGNDEWARGLMMLGLGGSCIGSAILTVDSLAQAAVQADPAGQDKGGAATRAALHLIAISRKWAGQTKGIGFRA